MILFHFVHSLVLLFLVFIARIIILMSIPILQTYPAKFMSTPTWILSTSHVVATLVFFNIFVANRTLLCINNDPVHIFCLWIMFNQPFLTYFTICRQVVLTIANVAILVLANTRHNKFFIDSFLFTVHFTYCTTVWWAITIFTWVYIILFDKVKILFEFNLFEITLPLWISNFNMTVGIGWTPTVDAIECRSFKFILQLTNHALFAHNMSTFQVIRTWLRQLVKTDCTLVRVQIPNGYGVF